MSPLILPAKAPDFRNYFPPGLPLEAENFEEGRRRVVMSQRNPAGETPPSGDDESATAQEPSRSRPTSMEATVSITQDGFDALIARFEADWPTLKPRRRALLFQRSVLAYLQWVLGETAAIESGAQTATMLAFIVETARASGVLP